MARKLLRGSKSSWAAVLVSGALFAVAVLASAIIDCASQPTSALAADSDEAPAAVPDPTTLPTSSVTDQDVIAYINAQIRQGWADAEITPSAVAAEGEWCRRVYLDIIGRIPSVDELQAFLSDKAEDKKALLVDRLLDSDEYVEEYARNWTTVWTNILIGRNGGNDDDSFINRSGMQQWLRRAFLKNKSYDQFVYELVSAQGSNTPGEDEYNGAVNFLVDNLNEQAATATAKVSRYFLGLQVQCTQCHNHPFNDWKQDQFWGMNAFFRQARVLRTFDGRDVVSVKLVDEDFAGEGSTPEEAEIYYELRNGLMQVAYPKFVDGTLISPSGYVEDVNRRTELAKLVVASPNLGQAIVNRMWAHFMGYGFTKPVDDLGPHNAASHPELLEKLGLVFSQQGHDLKRLIRWIVLSDPYQLSSRFGPKNKKDDPSLGERPLFSRFYLRQMLAEELYESLLVATEAHKTQGTYEEQEETKNEWLQQFTIAFGTDEGDETTTFNGTIPQALMMLNGELIQEATNCEPGSFLHRIATGNLKPTQQITYLYMAALARKPSTEEVKVANALLASRKGNPAEALQDVWWVLLNSNEFILNH